MVAQLANNSHGIAIGDFIRVDAIDATESYQVANVATDGKLTLNRGFRGQC